MGEMLEKQLAAALVEGSGAELVLRSVMGLGEAWGAESAVSSGLATAAATASSKARASAIVRA